MKSSNLSYLAITFLYYIVAISGFQFTTNMSKKSFIYNFQLRSKRFNTITLGFGSFGLLTILGNRMSIPIETVSNLQSRSDIISVIACSALLLNSLSDQDIQTKERPTVPLVGYALKSIETLPANKIGKYKTSSIEWLLKSLCNVPTVTSVHVYLDKTFISRCGVVGSTDVSRVDMPILHEAVDNKKQVYLPDLQILPGKVEFVYLPINIQSVLIIPLLEANGAIVVATNKAKSFNSGDLETAVLTVEIFESME